MAVLTPTSSAPNGRYDIYEGSNQDIVDTMESLNAGDFLTMGHNGTNYFAVYRTIL